MVRVPASGLADQRGRSRGPPPTPTPTPRPRRRCARASRCPTPRCSAPSGPPSTRSRGSTNASASPRRSPRPVGATSSSSMCTPGRTARPSRTSTRPCASCVRRRGLAVRARHHPVAAQPLTPGAPHRTAAVALSPPRSPPARRAWRRAAPASSPRCRPSRAARIRKITRFENGHHGVGDALRAQRRHEGDAQTGPYDDADDGAEDGQDHRLRADHGADLAPLHAHRAQQPDLVGALEDREHERVHDPDQGDDHGQAEQRVDQAEQLVDLGRLRAPRTGPGTGPARWGTPPAPSTTPCTPGLPSVLISTAAGSGFWKWARKNPSPARYFPARAFGW